MPARQSSGRDPACEITVFYRRFLTFILKTPLPPCFAKRPQVWQKGSVCRIRRRSQSGRGNRSGEIAELKIKDLNAIDIEGAMKQVEGTARSWESTL